MHRRGWCLIDVTAAAARWLELAGVPRGDAVAANPIIVQLENLILVGVAAFGLVHLLVKHALTPTVAASFAVVLAGVMLLIVLLVYSWRHPDRVARRVAAVVAALSRRVRHPRQAAPLEARILSSLQDGFARLGRAGPRALAAATASLAGDMACLYMIFSAAGHAVTPAMLLVGYGLPIIIGRASILPGGVGLVEVTMTALYASLGVPHDVLVVVVLVYRFLSFWLPAVFGLASAPLLNRGAGEVGS